MCIHLLCQLHPNINISTYNFLKENKKELTVNIYIRKFILARNKNKMKIYLD